MNIKSKNTNPLVSFCVFAYNQEKFIAEAIKGALQQTYSPLEIIISDDCSSDNTFQIIEKLVKNYNGSSKIILNRNEKNIGLTAHVNKVFAMAKGDIFIVAAGDDISLPNRTEEFVKVFRENNDIVSVSCSLTPIDSNGNKTKNTNEVSENTIYDTNDYISKENFHVNGASRAIKRVVFENFGDLNTKCPTEDTPYLLRSFMTGKVCLLSDELVLYRTHDNNLSGESNIYKMSINEIYRQYKKDIKTALDIGLIKEDIANILFKKIRLIKNQRKNRKRLQQKNKLKQLLFPPQKINLYWYKGERFTNFGDELSPFIISNIFNVRFKNENDKNFKTIFFKNLYRINNVFVKLRNKLFAKNNSLKIYHTKNVLAIGSIINKSHYNSKVWGSGIMYKNTKVEGGKFYAVRGYITIERLKELGLNAPNVVGDPALLLPMIYNPKIVKQYKLGIIPHYVDFDLINKNIINDETLIIDLTNKDIEYVVNQILSCNHVISSSLHGIIVSQAYKIPALWYKFSNNLAGDDIKFSDYFSSVKIEDYKPFKLDIENYNVDEVVKIIDENSDINSINTNLLTLQNKLINSAPFKRK